MNVLGRADRGGRRRKPGGTQRRAAVPSAITEDQAHDLRALGGEVKWAEKRFNSFFRIAAVEELPAGRYKEAVTMLQGKRR